MVADLGDPVALYGDVRCKGGEALGHGACQQNREPCASHQDHRWAQVEDTHEHHACVTGVQRHLFCACMHSWQKRHSYTGVRIGWWDAVPAVTMAAVWVQVMKRRALRRGVKSIMRPQKGPNRITATGDRNPTTATVWKPPGGYKDTHV